MPAKGGWEVEAGSSRVLERAPQGTACISRGRRGSQGQSRESLEDGVEGGRHRERSMHASLDQGKYFWGAGWSHG